MTLAQSYDQSEDVRLWKLRNESSLYDYNFIQQLMRLLKECRRLNDVQQLQEILQTHAYRNIAGIGNRELYKISFIGSKQLIMDFRQELHNSYQYLISSHSLSIEKKLEFLTNTRQALGKTALCLSGGAAFGLYHVGVIKTLWLQDMLPRIITGSSAGSLTASILCTTKQEHIWKIFEDDYNDFSSFANEDSTLSTKIKRFFETGTVKEIQTVADFMRDNIGDITFKEAYEKTGFILNITVTGSGHHDHSRVLNYLTAPNVVIWSACGASCAIPNFYASFKILQKNYQGEFKPWIPFGKKYIDGSIDCDIPLQKISELFNVSFVIVSQVNPFIIPFIDSETMAIHQIKRRSVFNLVRKGCSLLARKVKELVQLEFKLRIKQMREINVLNDDAQRLSNLVAQNYHGDINISPNPDITDYFFIMHNPDKQAFIKFKHKGEKHAFNKLNYIHAMIETEQLLESLYQKVHLMKHQMKRMHRKDDNDNQQIQIHRQMSKNLSFVQHVDVSSQQNIFDENQENSSDVFEQTQSYIGKPVHKSIFIRDNIKISKTLSQQKISLNFDKYK